MFVWADGSRYEGLFVDNKRQGYGTMSWPDGKKYEGLWADGEKHGEGKEYLVGGTVKSGIWENGANVKRFDEEDKCEGAIEATIQEEEA